jgi:hypothetical protein
VSFPRLLQYRDVIQEQTALDRQIPATDTQIDRLVYHLYGLTAEWIKLVGGA